MNKTPTPEQLQDAKRVLEHLREHTAWEDEPEGFDEGMETLMWCTGFTAKALGEQSKCPETGIQCRILTGNQYTHGTGACLDCGKKPIAGTIEKECAE